MNKLGFHYFPDTVHYRQSDLETWLPKLKSLTASWLVLEAPVNRALPEAFIRALVREEIIPIIHFKISPTELPSNADMELLYKTYSRWGVEYIVLFDKPNSQDSWGQSAWAQSELVESFLDIYIPLTLSCLQHGLTPIFPPLQPGGDFWDTAFLRASLESLQRRGHETLLENLIIGAYADAGNRPLSWGLGGPERWPGAIPYYTPPSEQDQRGFRIFDWYDTISKSVLMEPCPIFLFGLGCAKSEKYSENVITITQLLSGEVVEGHEPISNSVVGGAFMLVDNSQGWYRPDGEALPIVEDIHRRQILNLENASPSTKGDPKISHYLLLPSYQWGIPDFHLDALRPYIRSHQPTVGFSLEEAAQAERVTVIGSEEEFAEELLRDLRNKGCIVERIHGDGTTLATNIAKII